jgi:phosphoglucosamine mutase
MGKYFGTDGIRGTFGDACITPDFAYRMGAALGAKLPTDSIVVIGRDTRASGLVLTHALIQGFNAHKVRVFDLGVVPTPAVAGAVLSQKAAWGIAVTASHNPASDNGIKLFDAKACKLSPKEELQIETAIDAEVFPGNDLPEPNFEVLNGTKLYLEAVRHHFKPDSLAGLTVVLDLANGATCYTTPALFDLLGAKTVLMGNAPDGNNINAGVGSEHPIALGQAVLKNNADIGIAHDGDGDRLVVCDAKGEQLDGDCLLGILAVHALKADQLSAKTLVTTVQSNLGLDHAVQQAGGEVVRTDVGDRNVASRMRDLGANIGGENSGHLILSDYATTGDGLLAAVELIQLMRTSGQSLSELSAIVKLFPQATANLLVAEKIPFDQLSALPAAQASLEKAFGAKGRVMLRYSGTEPKLRLLVEGQEPAVVKAAMQVLEAAAHQDLKIQTCKS